MGSSVILMSTFFLFGLYLLKPIKKITVMEYQQALLYVNGRFKRILLAGIHWVCGSTKVTMVDMREQLVTIPGQEILTSDNITAKISLAIRYKIVDPLKSEHSCKNYIESLYSMMQIKLRELGCYAHKYSSYWQAWTPSLRI